MTMSTVDHGSVQQAHRVSAVTARLADLLFLPLAESMNRRMVQNYVTMLAKLPGVSEDELVRSAYEAFTSPDSPIWRRYGR